MWLEYFTLLKGKYVSIHQKSKIFSVTDFLRVIEICFFWLLKHNPSKERAKEPIQQLLTVFRSVNYFCIEIFDLKNFKSCLIRV